VSANVEMLEDAAERPLTVVLPNLGECTYRETEVIAFPWGLPGFPQLRRFLVLSVTGQEGFVWLQSLDEVKVALPLCDPWSLFADYEAPLPLYAQQSLALQAADDFCTLCVCVIREGAAEMTINLLAPVVINLKARIGRQITLENQRYSVRTPIPRIKASSEDPVVGEVVST
jgi:flagellar assembly factor FliW